MSFRLIQDVMVLVLILIGLIVGAYKWVRAHPTVEDWRKAWMTSHIYHRMSYRNPERFPDWEDYKLGRRGRRS